MELNDIPKPPSEKSSTRELIINILSMRSNLTGKEISNTLKKEFSKSVTYQAVHKELKALLGERMLLKDDKRYSLNPKWVEKISDYVSGLPKKPSPSLKLELEEKGVSSQSFERREDFARFCVEEFLALPSGGKDTICFLQHLWPAVSFSEKDIGLLREFFSKNKYILIGQYDTPMDIISKNFFEDIGAKVILGIRLGSEADIIVHGDCVGYFHLEPKFKKNMRRLFKLNKKFEKINLMKFLKPISFLKFPMDVVVVQNQAVAKKIRAQGIQYLRK